MDFQVFTTTDLHQKPQQEKKFVHSLGSQLGLVVLVVLVLEAWDPTPGLEVLILRAQLAKDLPKAWIIGIYDRCSI